MIIAVFACYFVAMLLIGYWAWSSTKNLDDFILGGRSLGAFPAALSAGASDMSGWLLLGLPGFAYMAGLEAGWMALGLFLGTWANWQFMAKPLRRASEEHNNSLTLPDFFANRFPELGAVLRFSSAALILLFFLIYTSSGLVAGGKLFESVLDVDYQLAVTLGLVAIVGYTMFGGFLAVTWTDVVQALLMISALVAIPIIALTDMGHQELIGAINEKNPALLNPFTHSDGASIGVIGILSLMGWGLGYFGQPHILARFMAIKSTDSVSTGKKIAVSWTFLTLIGSLFIGWTGISLVQQPGIDAEKIFIELIYLLTHPVISGLLLASILAAIMSTADSQLLVSSSALSNDIYRTLTKNATPRQLIWVGRLAVIMVAVFAWFLALQPDSTVLGLVSYAWAGFGAAFGPVLLLSLYWPPLKARGVLAGMITGALTVVIWKNLSGGIFELYEIIPGVALSALASIVTSLTVSGKASGHTTAH